MNNILSATKYRANSEGVSLMDETNNLLNLLAAEFQILRAICGHAHSAEAHKSHFSSIRNNVVIK
jgi:UDP-2,3-diacylglucosamine pyrophosphatase LpxH